MPIVKGELINGYIQVTKPVKFAGGMINLNTNPWGKSYFVDYENGNAVGTGLSPAASMKYLQDALDACSQEDNIYVRPYQTHAQYVGGDPASVLPESTANWSLAHNKWGVSIIGAGHGCGKAGNYATNLKGSVTVQATPTFDIRAPYVTLENLTFRRGGNTKGAVQYSFIDPGTTYSAFGGTVYNCTFWKIGSTSTEGALYLDSAWYMDVLGSTFISCYNGVHVGFSNSTTVGLTIKDCDFQGLAAEVSTDISTAAGALNTNISRCTFNHAIPSGGSPNVYVSFGATSSGMISDCFLGNASTTIATNMTLNGVVQSGCYTEEGEMVTD
jgi:hypothetical protein